MFYYFDIESFYGTQRHIFERFDDGSVRSFPLTDDNPNTPEYLAWVAEGNEAQPWGVDNAD